MPDIDFEKRIAQRNAIRSHMDAIGRKILVMSGKGGVGKTTVAVNLAICLAEKGLRIGLLDTDLHGPNVAKMFGVHHNEPQATSINGTIKPLAVRTNLAIAGIDMAMKESEEAVIWRGPMKMSAINELLARVAWGPLDFLIIDSPPGSGDEQITVCKSIPELTGAIIVTTPQEVSLLDSRRSIAFCRKMGIAIIGVVENMSGLTCPNCQAELPVFGIGGGEKMAVSTGTPFLGRIPLGASMSLDGGQVQDEIVIKSFNAIADLLEKGLTCSGIIEENSNG